MTTESVQPEQGTSTGGIAPYKHSFAKVWLKHRLGNQILINGQDFFNFDFSPDLFEVKPLHTYINIGDSLIDEKELEQISTISYRDMMQMGYAVYRMHAGALAWRMRQPYIYVIEKMREGFPEIPESTFSRRGYKIEINRSAQEIRGVGEDFGTRNGIYGNGSCTPWIYYGEGPRKRNRSGPIVKYSSYSDITEALINKWEGKVQNKIKKRYIAEMPVLITEDGYLVCMPKSGTVPTINIVGKRGKGKSFTMNSLIGRIHYIYNDRIGVLNDSLDQFYDLMLPTDTAAFEKELSRVGNEPRPLPVINLYMSCPNLEMRYMKEGISFRLVVSFKEFLRRWTYYTKGIKEWELGPPAKYMTEQVINVLDVCKNADQVKKALFALIQDAHSDKGKQAMIYKWVSTFENIFRSQFTSNLFKDEETTAPYWTLKTAHNDTMTGHPFIVCLEAGLVPVINNHRAKLRPIAKKNMSDLLYKIIDWQMARGDKKRRMWVCIDELRDFLGKKGDELYAALDYLFTQSRINKVGFIGNVQEYTKLSHAMKSNTTHLFIFELQTAEERNAVAKDYNLEKEKVHAMAELKTFQCLFTTKEKVVLYDREGRRSEAPDGGLWRGRVLPPITIHKSP